MRAPITKKLLQQTCKHNANPLQKSFKISRVLCPIDWVCRWRKIRDDSGFSGCWEQDILRHTYASFFAKCFKDLARLQVNMGHSNQMLLQHRYINMRNISRGEAKCFFN